MHYLKCAGIVAAALYCVGKGVPKVEQAPLSVLVHISLHYGGLVAGAGLYCVEKLLLCALQRKVLFAASLYVAKELHRL